MITAIDTSVLIDIFGADPKFGYASAEALRTCIKEGTICACEVVWTETAAIFDNRDNFLEAMQKLGMEYSELEQETSLIAADMWRRYRKSGGKRERVVADFLIGAHAMNQCDRLLTRDRGFYRDYYTKLKVVEPGPGTRRVRGTMLP